MRTRNDDEPVFIPAGYEVDRRRKKWERQLDRAGTGRHKKKHNPIRQLNINDHSRRATPPRDPFPDSRDQISHRRDRRRQEAMNCERTHARVRSKRRASSAFDSNGFRLKGELFGGPRRIPRDPRIDPLLD